MTSSPSGISPQFAACQQMVMKHKETSHRCGNSRTGWSFQQEGISDSRQKTGGKCPHGHSISQLSHRIDFNEPPEASSCIRRWQMPSRSRRCKKQAPSINGKSGNYVVGCREVIAIYKSLVTHVRNLKNIFSFSFYSV